MGYLVILILVILAPSCSNEVSLDEYLSQTKNSGLNKKFISDDYGYTLSHMPSEMIILADNNGEIPDYQKFQKAKQALDNFAHFKLTLTPLTIKSKESREFSYFHLEDFELKQLLLLHTADSVLEADFIHKQNEVNGRFSILLSFPLKINSNLDFECKDLNIPLFHFDYSAIKKIPNLKVDKNVRAN